MMDVALDQIRQLPYSLKKLRTHIVASVTGGVVSEVEQAWTMVNLQDNAGGVDNVILARRASSLAIATYWSTAITLGLP